MFLLFLRRTSGNLDFSCIYHLKTNKLTGCQLVCKCLKRLQMASSSIFTGTTLRFALNTLLSWSLRIFDCNITISINLTIAWVWACTGRRTLCISRGSLWWQRSAFRRSRDRLGSTARAQRRRRTVSQSCHKEREVNFLQFPIELTCWPQAPLFFSTGRNSILSVSIRIWNTSAKPSHAGPLNTWFVDHFHSLNFYGANIAVNAEAISGRRYKYTDMRFQGRLSEFTVLDSSCSPSGNNKKKKNRVDWKVAISSFKGGVGLVGGRQQRPLCLRPCGAEPRAGPLPTIPTLSSHSVKDLGIVSSAATSHLAPSARTAEVRGNLSWSNSFGRSSVDNLAERQAFESFQAV